MQVMFNIHTLHGDMVIELRPRWCSHRCTGRKLQWCSHKHTRLGGRKKISNFP